MILPYITVLKTGCVGCILMCIKSTEQRFPIKNNIKCPAAIAKRLLLETRLKEKIRSLIKYIFVV